MFWFFIFTIVVVIVKSVAVKDLTIAFVFLDYIQCLNNLNFIPLQKIENIDSNKSSRDIKKGEGGGGKERRVASEMDIRSGLEAAAVSVLGKIGLV